MKNIFSLLIGLLVTLFIWGCKQEPDTSYARDFQTIYMAKAVDLQSHIFQESTGSNKIYVGANYGGIDYAPEDIQVKFEIDASLVDTYNMQYGTDFDPLPSENVSFNQTESTIKKGQLQTSALPIDIDFEGLTTFKKYLIPVKITSISGNVALNETLSTTFFHVEIRSSPTPIKIMALGKGGANNDMDRLVAIIQDVNPDIVLIREIDKNTTRSGSSMDWPEILAEKLGPTYNHVFTPSILSYQGGQYGMSTYTKYKILKAENYELSANGTNQGPTAEKGPLGILELEVNGKVLKFAGIHTNSNATARGIQLSEAVQILGQNNEQPFILAGNMNGNPSGGDAYLAFSGIDFLPVCTTCIPNFPVSNPTSWSDMVLIRPANRINLINHNVGTSQQVIGGTHLPIITTLNIYF